MTGHNLLLMSDFEEIRPTGADGTAEEFSFHSSAAKREDMPLKAI